MKITDMARDNVQKKVGVRKLTPTFALVMQVVSAPSAAWRFL